MEEFVQKPLVVAQLHEMLNGCFKDQNDEANFEFYACFLGGIVCEGGTTS
jgi:hypothetical protein